MATESNNTPPPKQKRWWLYGIIGMLIALALYFIYCLNKIETPRTKISEEFVMAQSARFSVIAYYATHEHLNWQSGDLEADDIENFNASYNTIPNSKFVQSIQILPNGTIEIQYTKLVDGGGKKLLLIPDITNPRVRWLCIILPDGTLNGRDLPHECKNNN